MKNVFNKLSGFKILAGGILSMVGTFAAVAYMGMLTTPIGLAAVGMSIIDDGLDIYGGQELMRR